MSIYEIHGYRFEIDTMDWPSYASAERDEAENHLWIWLDSQPAEGLAELHADLQRARDGDIEWTSTPALIAAEAAATAALLHATRDWISGPDIGCNCSVGAA